MESLLIGRFEKYIRDNELIAPDDKVLLTVSGGVDSMVMMSLFSKTAYKVGVAHCNFQLRGAESDEDEVLVEQTAGVLGLEFFNKRFETRAEIERTGDSLEMVARRQRYDWFDELCRLHGYTVIAIAHQTDDSIETFFINLFRGTGLKGLTGIGLTRGKIIRPLLFASRKEITEYAVANHVHFREDSSNRTTKFLRNKIRLGLIPRIREINPKFTDLMRQNISRLIDAQVFIDQSIKVVRSTVQESRGVDFVIHVSRIPSPLPLNFVIYELLNSSFGFKGDVVDEICNSLESGHSSGKRFYSKSKVAYIDRGNIIISPICESDSCSVTVERYAPRAYCGNSVLYMEWLDVDNVDKLSVPENVALLDADKVEYPFTLRRRRDGDAFIPIGMTGHKKVSDFLVDTKVPLPEKQRQFVLESADRIAWIVGRRIDDRFKITSETENILKITKEII